MLQHKLLRISSEDRDVDISPSTAEFSVNFNNMGDVSNIKSVVVKSITIPNVFHNITPKNNTLTYNIAGTPTSVTIAEGQYNLADFKTALEAAASGIGLVITKNDISNRLLLATTTAVEWMDGKTNAMAEVLGIEIGRGSGADVTEFTPQGVVNLSGLRHVYVESVALGQSNMIRSNRSALSILAVVPITVPYGATEHYITAHAGIDDVDNSSQRHGQPTQKMDIRLLDRDGDVVNLMGHHATLILKIYY